MACVSFPPLLPKSLFYDYVKELCCNYIRQGHKKFIKKHTVSRNVLEVGNVFLVTLFFNKIAFYIFILKIC